MSSFSRACRAALVAVALLVVPLAACTGLRPVYQYGGLDAERMAVRFAAPSNRARADHLPGTGAALGKGGPDAPLVTVSASADDRGLTHDTITVADRAARGDRHGAVSRSPIADGDSAVLRSRASPPPTSRPRRRPSPIRQAADEAAAPRGERSLADTLRLEIYRRAVEVTALKAHEVERFVKRPDLDAGILLVYGPDTGLVRETAQRLVRHYAGADSDGMGLVTLDGNELDGDPGRLLVEARTSSLFGEKRVVRVRNAGKSLDRAARRVWPPIPPARSSF